MSNHSSPDVLDLLTDFPQATGAFAEMQRYIKQVSQFADFPSAQTVTRLKAELKRTNDPVREGELEYEIEVAETDGRSTMPRIVWGSILVAIYATFETGVKSALTHWGGNVPGAGIFDCKRQGQFLDIATEYAREQVGIDLFPSPSIKAAVLDLKTLRNSFAHSAGRVPSRRTELHQVIERTCARGYPIVIEGDVWVTTPRAAAFYFLQAQQAYKVFSAAMMGKYIACKAPSTEA
jgi:hypothetical protein